MNNNSKPRVAIYIRVSTLHQIDKDSLPMQREDLTNYCKYIFNTEDYEVFEDAGYSGKNTGRPAFQEMMIKIRKKQFTHILVWKIDRISRNLLDFSNMYEELKKYDVTFVSKSEQFDTSSAMGEAMLKIILVFAELERKLTSERVSATMISRATKGLWNGANVPLGYKWDPESKFPVPDDEEKEVVRLIYAKYIKHKSCGKVEMYLNHNNIPTKRGGFWTSKTVNDVLRNPFYKGTYRYNYRGSARGKIKKESEWIIIDDNHEAVIDKETWQIVNDILDQNANLYSSGKFQREIYTHFFSKKLICDKCGNGFIAGKDRPRNNGYRPSTYRCAGRYRKHICDAKMATDVVIGPFIVAFIRNIISAGSKCVDTLSELQDVLLEGKQFEYIDSINKEDLELLYVALYKADTNNKNISVKKIQEDVISEKDVYQEREFIKSKLEKFNKEKNKYINALKRLEELYFFSVEGVSKSDYVIKKKSYENKLKNIEENIKQFYKINDAAKNIKDVSFIMSYEQFLFNNALNNGVFDYMHLVTNMNNKVLKDLIDTIIKNIHINNNKVTKINFNNGLMVRFSYL